jgi:hypothetical protein
MVKRLGKGKGVSEWHEPFKEVRENMEDDEKDGCPRSHRTDENVGKVWILLHSVGHLSMRAILVQLNLKIKQGKRPELCNNDYSTAHKALSVK